MLYEFPFTISKNTSRDSPYEETVKLEYGLIDHIGIEFPDGCVGYVGVRIFNGSFQLSPKNTDAWHVSNDYVIEHRPYYELFTEPYVLRLVGYNEDDSYDHTPIVRISLIPERELIEYVSPRLPPVVYEEIPIPEELV